MFKKTIFIGFLMLSLLSIPALTYAAQYYDQYPGNGFVPDEASANYSKAYDSGSLYHNDTDDMYYYCPVSFNVPNGSNYFIKSIGMRYKDNLADGYLNIRLYRHNLYTGAAHIVADWSSGYSEAIGSAQTASQGTYAGYKLIDKKKFAYFLYVYFFKENIGSSGNNLILYQVRIHYGT